MISQTDLIVAEELVEKGRYQQALDVLDSVEIADNKNRIEYLYLRLFAENRLQRLLGAIATARELSKKRPLNKKCCLELAGLNILLGRTSKARKWLLLADGGTEKSEEVLTEIALSYETEGEMQEAKNRYELVVKNAMDGEYCSVSTVRAFRRVASYRSYKPEETFFLQGMAKGVNAQIKKSIFYGLAASSRKANKTSDEIEYLKLANELSCTIDCQASAGWSEKKARKLTQSIVSPQVGDYAQIKRLRSKGDKDLVPIFVLALPRSGTTFVDQVICASKDVDSTGESRALSQAWSQSVAKGDRSVRLMPSSIFDNFANMKESQKKEIVKYYTSYQRLLTKSKFVTDKNLSNVLWIGVIENLFKNARFVHVVRNPLDCCVSLLQQDFSNAPYSYNSRSALIEYIEYRKRMDFWKKLFPDKVCFVHYEALVADFEQEAKRLYSFLGLKWSDDVLRFHELKNSVRTPSLSQVRQAVSNKSVGKWHEYSPLLSEALDYIEEDESIKAYMTC